MNRSVYGLAVAAALLTSTHGARSEEVKIGYLPLVSHMAYYADELGLFKKYGINATVTAFRAGPALGQAVLAGDYQVGEIAIPPMIHLASQGAPVYFLVSGGIESEKYPAGVIMVRKDEDGIKSFNDLKGRSIGQLAHGTLTYMRLFVAAKHFGLKRDDFKEVFVPFPQMGALLASKQVDAVYAWPPFDTLIARADQGKVLVQDSEWVRYAVSNGVFVSKAWADKNPAIVKKIAKIWIETARMLARNPDQARAIMAKRLNLSEAVAKETSMPYWPRNGYMLMPSIWDTYYLMVETNQIKPVANIGEVIKRYWIEPAEKWVTPAVNELGREPDLYARELAKMKLPNLPGDPEKFYGPWQK